MRTIVIFILTAFLTRLQQNVELLPPITIQKKIDKFSNFKTLVFYYILEYLIFIFVLHISTIQIIINRMLVYGMQEGVHCNLLLTVIKSLLRV
jgi:hypothetical protein